MAPKSCYLGLDLLNSGLTACYSCICSVRAADTENRTESAWGGAQQGGTIQFQCPQFKKHISKLNPQDLRGVGQH